MEEQRGNGWLTLLCMRRRRYSMECMLQQGVNMHHDALEIWGQVSADLQCLSSFV